jgi:nitric oxide reductase NorQ protein
MTFGYPEADLERQIVCRETGIDEQTAASLVDLAASLRQLQEHDLEEGASTRLLVYAARLMQCGVDAKQACLAALIEPLTDDDETRLALAEVIHAKIS